MQTIRRTAYIIAIVTLVLMLDIALSFILIPYGSKSEIVWADYHEQQTVDTVIFGDSLAQQGVNPYTIDNQLTRNSFNLSSPAQDIEETYVAIKEVLSQHKVKQILYCIEFDMLLGETVTGPQNPYLFEKWRYDSFQVIWNDFLVVTNEKNWIKGEQSINWLFPWIKNHVPYDLQRIADNVRMRLDGTSLAEAAMTNEVGWTYVGKGFGTYSKTADFNKSHKYYTREKKTSKISEQKAKKLRKLCSLCNEYGVDFVVVVMPMPSFNLLYLGDNYQKLSQSVRTIVEKKGGTYLDFNLATPEVFANSNDLYRDYQHLNSKGADSFSDALAEVLKERDAGKDIDTFFSSLSERLDSIEGVQTVDLTISNSENGSVLLSGTAYAKPGADIEYRFGVKRENEEDFSTIQTYSTSSQCSFTPNESGSYTFSLTARIAGSTENYDCYSHKTVRL